jgi:hypothetical protein
MVLFFETKGKPGWGRPTPTLVPWRQGFRLQQGTSVGVGLPKPANPANAKMNTTKEKKTRLTEGNATVYVTGANSSIFPSFIKEVGVTFVTH